MNNIRYTMTTNLKECVVRIIILSFTLLVGCISAFPDLLSESPDLLSEFSWSKMLSAEKLYPLQITIFIQLVNYLYEYINWLPGLEHINSKEENTIPIPFVLVILLFILAMAIACGFSCVLAIHRKSYSIVFAICEIVAVLLPIWELDYELLVHVARIPKNINK